MNEIKSFREKHGLKKIEFARLFRVKQSTSSLWESGERKIPPYILQSMKFFEFCGVRTQIFILKELRSK